MKVDLSGKWFSFRWLRFCISTVEICYYILILMDVSELELQV